jgi:hypothetical protein
MGGKLRKSSNKVIPESFIVGLPSAEALFGFAVSGVKW